MKNYFLQAIFLCLFSPSLFGQYVPNQYFAALQQLPCPFDTTQTVDWPVNWMVYQTTDGNWDGPVDSTRCLSTSLGQWGYGARLDLSTINPAMPVFFKANLNAPGLETNFLPNTVCNIQVSFQLEPNCQGFETGNTCAQDLCSGALAGIAIPDELGVQGAAIRLNTSTPEFEFPSPNSCNLEANACFPTEYFEEQTLQFFVLKFSWDPLIGSLDGRTLQVNVAGIDQLIPDWVGHIADVPASAAQLVGDHYEVPAYAAAQNNSFNGNYLMEYTALTYPGAANPSYVEAYPVPNTTDQQTINLIVDPWETLEIQPFTHLRGALVAGSDSIRHIANLVNMGGDICMNYIDVIFSGGNEYRHGGGQLDLNNSFSCMQFRQGSALRVMEDATLHYGNDGTGMLALCANSTIHLERNATLVVDGVLNIAECDNALPQQHLYMNLPQGAQLIFTDKARLTNRFSQEQQMLLFVRMLGGVIDYTASAPEDRALIRRLYPSPAPEFSDNLKTGPNPCGSSMQLAFLSVGNETLELRWLDTNGRIVQEEQYHTEKGPNQWEVSTPEKAGCYFLNIRSGKAQCMRKIIKMRP
ncbi:MAG: hypothetical protein IPL65_08190 [Lewinellaceae bacterium]|nr:hypothetical protein [Lewinellaceae bacterium]